MTVTEYKYQGKERDIETGYDYFEARFYDSAIGRFLQVDPMADIAKHHAMNPYMGMFNNPINVIDPTGMVGVSAQYRNEEEQEAAQREEASWTNIDDDGLNNYNAQKIAVDAGHGPADGAKSPDGKYLEKDLAYDIAKIVYIRLKQFGLISKMTRAKDSNKKGNKWRATFVDGSTMFVSIHLDALAKAPKVNGSIILYKVGSNESKELAEYISKSLDLFRRRGVAKGMYHTGTSEIAVLKEFTGGPAVLIETGFITNTSDRNKAINQKWEIGSQIARGIKNYLLLKK